MLDGRHSGAGGGIIQTEDILPPLLLLCKEESLTLSVGTPFNSSISERDKEFIAKWYPTGNGLSDFSEDVVEDRRIGMRFFVIRDARGLHG